MMTPFHSRGPMDAHAPVQVAQMARAAEVPVAAPDRRVGLAAWALVVGILLVVFGVVPELVAQQGLAKGPAEAAAHGLTAHQP